MTRSIVAIESLGAVFISFLVGAAATLGEHGARGQVRAISTTFPAHVEQLRGVFLRGVPGRFVSMDLPTPFDLRATTIAALRRSSAARQRYSRSPGRHAPIRGAAAASARAWNPVVSIARRKHGAVDHEFC